MSQSITAVILDLDGVMIDSEPLQLAAYDVVLEPHGVHLSEADFIRRCVGRKSRENFTFLREHFALTATVEELLAAKDAVYSIILRDNMRPMPGLLSLLGRLKASGFSLAVASSSRLADIQAVLAGLAIAEDFGVCVSGEQVARGKPEPDIFLETARRLNVAPQQCVVLEDAEAGVTAAVRAGMRCIAVPNRFTASQDFSQASARVPNLDAVRLPVIRGISGRRQAKQTAEQGAVEEGDVRKASKPVPLKFVPYDRHKLLVHSDRIRSMLAGQMVDPVTVDIEPTNACNHDCFWCYNRDFRYSHWDTLPAEIMLSVIDSFRGTGIRGVIFSGGGEPLMHPQIDDALTRVADTNLDCCLYTNGALIHEHLDAIAQACRSLNISLDAGSTATHQFMHRPSSTDGGDWNQVLQNLEAVKQRVPNAYVNVSFVAHSRNYKEVGELAQRLGAIGVDLLHVKAMVTYKAHLDGAKVEELDEQLELARSYMTVTVTGPGLTPQRLYPDRCRATPLKALVAADGRMYVCCRRREPEYALGDLRERDFWSIWRDPSHQQILSGIVPARCGECPQVDYNDLIDHVFESDEMQTNFI